MSRKPPCHRVKVAKRNLYGSLLWWATCTCGWFQGCSLKQDARMMATEHDYHWMCDATSAEARRRGKPELYEQARHRASGM